MANQVDVRAGALSPETLTITITTAPVVGTTVTTVGAVLERPDGTEITATLTPTATTSTTATVQWVFNADALDIPTVGVARMFLTLQPSGRRCEPIVLRVRRYS